MTNLMPSRAVDTVPHSEDCLMERSNSTARMGGTKFSVKSSSLQYLFIAAYILITFYVAYILYVSLSKEIVLFTWHPILMTVGWTFFMAQSTFVLYAENPCVRRQSNSTRVRLHWIMQLISTALVTMGFIVVYINKNIHNKGHFKTYHATFGLVSLILMFIANLTGVLAVYSESTMTYMKIVLFRFVHGFSGIVTFVLGLITTILGFYSHWFLRETPPVAQFICMYIIALVTVLTLIKPTVAAIRRIRCLLR